MGVILVIFLTSLVESAVKKSALAIACALSATVPTVFPLLAFAAPIGASPYSNYASASGSTILRLNHETGAMDYQTQVKGQVWAGQVQPLRRLGQNGNRSIGGTFRDVLGRSLVEPAGGPSAVTFCAGDFVTSQTVENNRYVLQATWRVTSGQNCPSQGQSFNLRLMEALPVADRQGDFFFENSKAWYGLDSGQNDFHTWDRWQVVDASGSLNCRAQPNGAVVKTYRRGDRLNAAYDARGVASAILGAENRELNPSTIDPKRVKGAPWLLTKDRCFVRANSRYVQPLAAAQDF